ncbi:hypothetical protein F511_24295 [Dorcoceras hygrometricum]|uniref:Uncharacterized protein n=1 Tax=Dorcoceras hygrometricum TaxID=472368 RepID=A0A2Z7C6Z3_9LAMI|nr:hypothetical protein F511_24295 [Dorcoceras hygrometricum]
MQAGVSALRFKLSGACRGARVTPVPHLPAGTVSHRYHGYSAGRGVDPTGGVPGGG